MKLRLLILFILVGCGSTQQTTQPVTPVCPTCPPTPLPVIIHDTVTVSTALHDTVFTNLGDTIRDTTIVVITNPVVVPHENIQEFIDSCIAAGQRNFYFPHGFYMTYQPLIFKSADGSFLVGITISGDGPAYDNSPTETVIMSMIAFGPAVDFERVKGGRMNGITVMGQNIQPSNLAVPMICSNQNVSFVSPGVSDSQHSPYTGIAVDYYSDSSIGGSTDIVITDCAVRNFVVDYFFSANALPQNGEIIRLENDWGDNCKVAIAVGQSQNRSIMVNNFHCWGTETLIDCANYGAGNGCPPTVNGLNAAGAIRYLCKLNTWVSNGLLVENSHIESLWSLGGCDDPTDGILILQNDWVALIGSLPISIYGQPVTQPQTTFRGALLRVIGGRLWEYGTGYDLPIAVSSPVVDLDGAMLDFVPINNDGPATYMRNTFTPLFSPTGQTTNNYPFKAVMTVTANDPSLLHTTFTLLNEDIDSVVVGDMILFRSPDEYGANLISPMGKVLSISGNAVTVSGRAIPMGDYAGQIYRTK